MSKKTLIIGLSLAVIAFSGCKENDKRTGGNTVVKGKLENSNGDTLYLVNVSQRDFVYVDSVITGPDGSFEFRPTLEFKGFYNIEVGKSGEQFATIILEPKDSLEFTGDAKDLGYSWKAHGAKDTEYFLQFNEYFTAYDKKRRPYTDRLDSLQRSFQIQLGMMTDSVAREKLEKEVIEPMFNEAQEKLNEIADTATIWLRNFIDAHPGSFANIPALRLLEPYDNFPYWEKTIDSLEKNYKTAPNVVVLRDLVEERRPHCIGQIVPDIALNDVDGKPVRLSDLRGNVVLIDFWASWCAPCRAELPNVVKNYNQYHSKGFEVFSVSLDNDKNAWTGAIKSDGLVWKNHVSDLMQWQSPVVSLYEFQGIPFTVLIDRQGRMIAKDLRGDELSDKLAEVFSADSTSTK